MKVTVVRGGGLTGAVLTVSVDSADLDDDEAESLRARVAALTAGGADRPPRHRPDGARVELTVEGDGGDASAVRFDEHDAPDGATDLVGWVLECPAGVRRTGR